MVLGLFERFIDIIIHLDTYLGVLIQKFGIFTYVIFFLIVFAETGLVIAPFLPGDSLLFAAGAFAAQGSFNVMILFAVFCIAAILGDSLNYRIGMSFGRKAFTQDSKYFKKEYLLKTEQFYEKHGSKTIILARFVPIIRTFAPFVAGIGQMQYSRFLFYNIFGGILWVVIFLFGGYYFGTIPFVKDNFTLVILGIIVISLLPALREFIVHVVRRKKRQQ